MVTEQELAYVAGFFDGEGWVGISVRDSHKAYKYYVLDMTITNTNLEILEWIQECFGGYIVDKPKREVHHRQGHVWKTSANNALEFLSLIKPFVRVKRVQVSMALTFKEMQDSVGHIGRGHPRDDEDESIFEMFREGIKRLNSGGEV